MVVAFHEAAAPTSTGSPRPALITAVNVLVSFLPTFLRHQIWLVTVNEFEGAIIIPCFGNNGDWLFACGFGNCGTANFTMTSSLANELVLRPTQLSSAVTAAGSSFATDPTPTEVTSNASTSASQPDDSECIAGEMAGVGVGVGVTLLIIIGVLSWLLFREKRRKWARRRQQLCCRSARIAASHGQRPSAITHV